MNKKTNFNKKAKTYLSTLGYVTEMTEHYNAFSGHKNDFGGFADAIGLNPDAPRSRILAVQITSLNNVSARFNKITKSTIKDSKTGEDVSNPVPEKAKRWLLSGGGLWILGFDGTAKRGERQGKIREVYLDESKEFTFQDTAI